MPGSGAPGRERWVMRFEVAAILFDIDGTLVDSTAVVERSWRTWADGLPTPPVLIAAEDVRFGKPDPEGYLKAAAALGQDIAGCLVIEDAPAGVAAARTAGAQILAVATTHAPSRLTTADAVIPDLTACRVSVRPQGLAVTIRSRTAGVRRDLFSD